MQPGNLVAERRLQPLAQIVRKEWMVAKPMALVIERREQQLTLLNRPKPFLAGIRAGHNLTQRHAQPVEYRRTKHKLNHVARQAVEQFPEIGTNGALDAREIAHIMCE